MITLHSKDSRHGQPVLPGHAGRHYLAGMVEFRHLGIAALVTLRDAGTNDR